MAYMEATDFWVWVNLEVNLWSPTIYTIKIERFFALAGSQVTRISLHVGSNSVAHPVSTLSTYRLFTMPVAAEDKYFCRWYIVQSSLPSQTELS